MRYSMVCAGKAKAAGPEVKRGRTDLAETLWQTSNPYKDGRSLGDQWMEAKGKQRVEGPEMRRGRRVLPPFPPSPLQLMSSDHSINSCPTHMTVTETTMLMMMLMMVTFFMITVMT